MVSKESKNNITVKGREGSMYQNFMQLVKERFSEIALGHRIFILFLIAVLIFSPSSRGWLFPNVIFEIWFAFISPDQDISERKRDIGNMGLAIGHIGWLHFIFAMAVYYPRWLETEQVQESFRVYMNFSSQARDQVLLGSFEVLIGLLLYIYRLGNKSWFIPICMILTLPIELVRGWILYSGMEGIGSFADFYRLPGNLLALCLTILYAAVGGILILLRALSSSLAAMEKSREQEPD